MVAKQDYTYSLDADNNLVNIVDAKKGNEYFCPSCGAQMILKQGAKRKWHFAHKNNVSNCSYETYLHKIAKRRIRECFEYSPNLIISFRSSVTCNVVDCPLGALKPCSWRTLKSFDLKKYYDCCREEVSINGYVADLFLTNEKHPNDPILIEIYVTHKSTEEKLKSNLRIIEIHIKSEDDINQIISTAEINESEDYNKWGIRIGDRIGFYNFHADSYARPDKAHQLGKYGFWINPKGYYNFGIIKVNGELIKCLMPNPLDVENSIFRIESMDFFDTAWAFKKLLQSGLGIRYCTMCNFYRWNQCYGKSICILYKSRGTKKFPPLSDALNCIHFEQVDYNDDVRQPYNGYRITKQ